MAFSFSTMKSTPCIASKPSERFPKNIPQDNLKSLPTISNLCFRRSAIMSTTAASIFIVPFLTGWNLGPIAVKAEETSPRIEANKADDDNSGVLGAIQSFFDPNEKTKSGKTLPKSYLKSVKEVVKTLRKSLQEDSNDVAKFRRSADAARESIGEFLNEWRGQPSVSSEESYVSLEKAIRTLAEFYSRNGPLAPMPDTIKSGILNDLDTAEAFL